MPLDGILAIDKPGGMTSHDVVNRVRKIVGIKRVGHTGTLDPMATGVLVICLGQATRVVEYLTAERKEYHAGITFGVETDSQDSTGAVVRETDSGHLTRDAVERALEGFRGRIQQIPPMVSAVHHEGRRLYELARKGIEVERKPRDVEIHRLTLVSFEPGSRAQAWLEIECSTGTYIRTLAADIGAALGVGAMMHSLRRTRVGAFMLSECITLEELQTHAAEGTLAKAVHSIPEALSAWPQISLDDNELTRVTHGQAIQTASLHSGPFLLLTPSGEAAAIAEMREAGMLAPVKVLRNPD